MKRDARALLISEFESKVPKPADPSPNFEQQEPIPIIPEDLPESHISLIKVAHSLKKADVPLSEASKILSSLKSTDNFYSTDPVFKILKEQFKPEAQNDLYDQILNYVKTTTGKFWSRDVAVGLGISKPGPKRQISLILREMVTKDVLESVENRHDYFVLVDRDCEEIEL